MQLVVLGSGTSVFHPRRASAGFWLQTTGGSILLDCSAIFDIEYTALKMLAEAEERLRRDGMILWLAALNPDVLTVVKRSKLGETLGRDRMFFNRQTAVEHYERTRSSTSVDYTSTDKAGGITEDAFTEERR